MSETECSIFRLLKCFFRHFLHLKFRNLKCLKCGHLTSFVGDGISDHLKKKKRKKKQTLYVAMFEHMEHSWETVLRHKGGFFFSRRRTRLKAWKNSACPPPPHKFYGASKCGIEFSLRWCFKSIDITIFITNILQF